MGCDTEESMADTSSSLLLLFVWSSSSSSMPRRRLLGEPDADERDDGEGDRRRSWRRLRESLSLSLLLLLLLWRRCPLRRDALDAPESLLRLLTDDTMDAELAPPRRRCSSPGMGGGSGKSGYSTGGVSARCMYSLVWRWKGVSVTVGGKLPALVVSPDKPGMGLNRLARSRPWPNMPRELSEPVLSTLRLSGRSIWM